MQPACRDQRQGGYEQLRLAERLALAIGHGIAEP